MTLSHWTVLRRLVARAPSEWVQVERSERAAARALVDARLAVARMEVSRGRPIEVGLYAATDRGRAIAAEASQ